MQSIIPDSVKSLGIGIFSSCDYLSFVQLGDGLTVIPKDAFFSCYVLSNINLSNITKIEENAFKSCSNLEAPSFSDKLTEVGSEAFISCTKIKSVSLPSSLEKIGEKAFGFEEDSSSGEKNKVADFSISSSSNSVAEKYAKENNISFISK